MEEKLISVIVTVYNREKYLDECLTSLKNQIYQNFEALIIDDGSTDSSIEIAEKYTNEDSRFKLIKNSHVGFPEAKNIGLRAAAGDYIIFLDSDDSAYPGWLKILYDLCEFTGAEISTCLYDEYNEKTGKAPELDIINAYHTFIPISEYTTFKMNLLFQNGCSSYMWNKLVKKDLYNGIQFKDQIAMSDISTTYKIMDKATKVVQVNLPLIHYRRHEDGMGNKSLKELGATEYFKLRMTILKEVTSFVWNKYPLSRRAVQLVIKQELSRIQKLVPQEDYEKYIYTEDIQQIFKVPTVPFVNVMTSQIKK